MNDAIISQLDKIAASDMRLARKQGSLLVGQTRFGTVNITYNSESKNYSMKQNGGAFMNLGTYTARELKTFLVERVYDVVQ